MELYEIIVKKSVRKDLKGIEKKEVARILKAIEGLAADPRPQDSKKLKGENLYRLRKGNYRIVYEIEDQKLVVIVIKVGNRREIYRRRK